MTSLTEETPPLTEPLQFTKRTQPHLYGGPPSEPQFLPCPRCASTNTKFCYYNLRQPRHFCKSCKRYWTQGGALRNIPVGGRTRSSSKKRCRSGSFRYSKADSDEQALTLVSPLNYYTSNRNNSITNNESEVGHGSGSDEQVSGSDGQVLNGDVSISGRSISSNGGNVLGTFGSLLYTTPTSYLGFGLGNGSGYEEMGLGLGFEGGHGLGRGGWPSSDGRVVSGEGNMWQIGSSEFNGGEGYLGDGLAFIWLEYRVSPVIKKGG